jgi:hypothetical protein
VPEKGVSSNSEVVLVLKNNPETKPIDSSGVPPNALIVLFFVVEKTSRKSITATPKPDAMEVAELNLGICRPVVELEFVDVTVFPLPLNK